jgi:hypothetical protein
VCARIIDPEFSPWQPYTDPTAVLNGPYFEPFVISGVGANVTTPAEAGVNNYTIVPLARVDQPSGAASITSAMIVDLRRLARPRFAFEDDTQNGFNGDEDLLTSETNWHFWPLNTYSVYVPPWANRASASIHLNNVLVDRLPGDFNARVNFGGLTVSGFSTGTNLSTFDYNGSDWSPVGFVSTRPHTVYGEFDVTSLRGQTVTVRPEVMRTWTANTGRIWFRPTEQINFDVRFRETAA